jgi:hypothetical protein
VLAELLATIALGAQPAADPPVVVWAVGDGAFNTEPARRLGSAIARDRPDRFLYLGDVYDSGTRAEFQRNYEPVYGALAPITAPTPGNHDWPNRATGYFPYWKSKLGRALPSWYGFKLGGWEILSLNSEAPHGEDSKQLLWLDRRLAATPGNCRIAFWHRPRFSAGRTHGDQRDVAPLWDRLQGDAALVLNGHEHDSQRLKRRGGVVQLVAGAGGASFYPLNRGDRRLVWGSDGAHAALRIELTPGRARFEFRTAGGRVLHRGSVGCSAADPQPPRPGPAP